MSYIPETTSKLVIEEMPFDILVPYNNGGMRISFHDICNIREIWQLQFKCNLVNLNWVAN